MTKPLTFISLFAGIGGFDLALERAGAQCVAQVEIDAKARAVLRRHWPAVPQFDDVRTVGAHNLPAADIVCGGSPCQDLSVAGKRAGLDGERSGLFFQMIRVIDEIKPKFVIWENVPGALSSNNGLDFQAVIDEFIKSGYIPDVNILDAQNFGLAQRRRRIFAVCTHAQYLRQSKTPTSLSVMVKIVSEILLTILAEAKGLSGTAPYDLEFRSTYDAIGLQKKMSLFGLTSQENWTGLLIDLIETAASCQSAQSDWDTHLRNMPASGSTAQATLPSDRQSQASEQPYGRILKLWSSIWDERYSSQNAYIISTALKQTTESTICTCAEIASIIASCIRHWTGFFQTYWDAALSSLIAEQEYTDYARLTSSTFFTPAEWIQHYYDYLVRHERRQSQVARADIGAKRCAEILSLAHRSPGHFAPGAGARPGAAAHASASAGDSRQDVGQTLAAPRVARQAKGGFTDPVSDNIIAADIAATLTSGPSSAASHNKPSGRSRDLNLVAFQQNQRDELRDLGEVVGAINSEPGMHNQNFVAFSSKDDGRDASEAVRESGDRAPALQARMGTGGNQVPLVGVRRLTPVECERLQGFPDGWTEYGSAGTVLRDMDELIGYIKGAAETGRELIKQADSTRYRQLGNAVAVPVVEWIARRLVANYQAD